jgi:hypothetical protein
MKPVGPISLVTRMQTLVVFCAQVLLSPYDVVPTTRCWACGAPAGKSAGPPLSPSHTPWMCDAPPVLDLVAEREAVVRRRDGDDRRVRRRRELEHAEVVLHPVVLRVVVHRAGRDGVHRRLRRAAEEGLLADGVVVAHHDDGRLGHVAAVRRRQDVADAVLHLDDGAGALVEAAAAGAAEERDDRRVRGVRRSVGDRAVGGADRVVGRVGRAGHARGGTAGQDERAQDAARKDGTSHRRDLRVGREGGRAI